MRERTCRVCGCSQNKACIDEAASALDIEPIGCHWVAKDLCNVCDEKAKAIKLSLPLQLQMAVLATRNAFSRERSYFGRDTSAGTVGALVRRGLADKRVVVKRRAQRTQYWLTPLGREVSRRRGGGQ